MTFRRPNTRPIRLIAFIRGGNLAGARRIHANTDDTREHGAAAAARRRTAIAGAAYSSASARPASVSSNQDHRSVTPAGSRSASSIIAAGVGNAGQREQHRQLRLLLNLLDGPVVGLEAVCASDDIDTV